MSEFIGPALPPDLLHEVIEEEEEQDLVTVGPVLPPDECSQKDKKGEVARLLHVHVNQ